MELDFGGQWVFPKERRDIGHPVASAGYERRTGFTVH